MNSVRFSPWKGTGPRLILDRSAVDFAAGIIDVAAQLATLFCVHLLTLFALRLESFITFTTLGALAAEIILRPESTTLTTAFIALGAAIPLCQHKAGSGNARTKQQKMR